MAMTLDAVKEYNRKRDFRAYLLGLQQNLGADIRLSELISRINMELIVLEKQISNNNTEQ